MKTLLAVLKAVWIKLSVLPVWHAAAYAGKVFRS